MEVDKPSSNEAQISETITPLPEIDMYLSLLVLIWLIDQKQLDKVSMDIVNSILAVVIHVRAITRLQSYLND
jgi:hypothetical protein